MNTYFFLFLNLLILIIRTFLAIPLIVLKNFIRPLFKRIDFERKNLFSEASESFAELNLKANYFFHLSSEGELEQVRTLIDYFLANNKRIEICYTSPSVEKKCMQIYEANKSKVRILRLPLASFFPLNFLYFQSLFQFITSPKVIMCRYDFFPELLILKLLNKKMILVSAATKKMNWHKKSSLLCFDLVIGANQVEARELNQLLKKDIEGFDFRLLRIWDRKLHFQTKIDSDLKIEKLINYIKKFDGDKIVLGSAWKADLAILDQNLFNENILIVIAPHQLGEESINEIKEYLQKYQPFIYDGKAELLNQKLIINTLPGILCELYQYFDIAYVGGGFGKSVHSVLEPFLMGAKVITGPVVHRSCEVDFVKDLAPLEISILNSPDLFYNYYKELKKMTMGFDREKFVLEYSKKSIEVIKAIE